MDVEQQQDRRPSNAHVVATLKRLADMLKNDEAVDRNPPHLSHYRELPNDVTKAYELIQQGAELVRGTATKYTLIGKIDGEEQKKLGADLLRGCEILGAATHALLQDSSGCSRAVRRATQRAALAILLSVIHLAESFDDQSALNENVGAQKTGAVWESCDRVLNKMIPQGNRNAIRRELFTWTRETNDSMEEFQEMIDLGPADKDVGADVEEAGDFFGGDEQYSDDDLPIASACLGILKCSRGTIKLTLEACEDLGSKYAETEGGEYLDWLAQLHQLVREVGEGVTDMGSLMYPPILPDPSDLQAQVQTQVDAVIKLHDFVLGLERMPSSVGELANLLHGAVDIRHKEFLSSIQDGKL